MTEKATALTKSLQVSVIVPVFRGGDEFRCCMRALLQSDEAPFEIIVIADGGMQGSPYPEKRANVRVIETALQAGPGAARNIGARVARGDILLFVDADVEIKCESIGGVIKILQAQPALAALFGSYDDAPGKPNFFSQYRNLLHHYVHQTGHEEASTFWTGFGAIRRPIFLDSGGFNERLSGVEDIDLGYRLKKAGHQIRLCKMLEVKHLKYWSALSILKTDFFQRALPWTKLILNNSSVENDLNIDRRNKISVLMTACLLLGVLGLWWWPVLWGLCVVSGLTLLFTNRGLYFFFKKKRGLPFTSKAIVCHWVYFFYSGLAFLIGFFSHFLNVFKPGPVSLNGEKDGK